MSASKKIYYPPEILKLIELGREGKLWTIEVIYKPQDQPDAKRMVRRNMTGQEVLQFRESMFKVGFTIPLGENHWQIVCPLDIHTAYLTKQSGYFAEE